METLNKKLCVIILLCMSISFCLSQNKQKEIQIELDDSLSVKTIIADTLIKEKEDSISCPFTIVDFLKLYKGKKNEETFLDNGYIKKENCFIGKYSDKICQLNNGVVFWEGNKNPYTKLMSQTLMKSFKLKNNYFRKYTDFGHINQLKYAMEDLKVEILTEIFIDKEGKELAYRISFY